MNQQKPDYHIWYMIANMKVELLDILRIVEVENEQTYPRKDIAKDVLTILESCQQIEEICSGSLLKAK